VAAFGCGFGLVCFGLLCLLSVPGFWLLLSLSCFWFAALLCVALLAG
jgi:hypothetical protein